MFAKPFKKPAVPAPNVKSKNLTKPKTVSVKAGIKATNIKSSRTKGEPLQPRPPPRPDPSYSLYSTDSEDQVAIAFSDMDKCEKILTHLRNKQKGQPKVKKRKKKASDSPQPKALNDIQPGSLVNVDPSTGLPLGAAEYLRQLHAQELTSNPAFNFRLSSSTPDPEKHLSDNLDQSASKHVGYHGNASQDIPERDLSTVSTVPPTANHLQNMAEMVEIYKALEVKKYQQMKEAAALAELAKLHSATSSKDSTVKMDSQKQNLSSHEAQDLPGCWTNIKLNLSDRDGGQNRSGSTCGEKEDSEQRTEGFIGTGSLGFNLNGYNDMMYNSSNQNISNGENRHSNNTQHFTGGFNQQLAYGRLSSPTAFQPFINRDSPGSLPAAWLMDSTSLQTPQQQFTTTSAPCNGQFLANLCTSSFVVEPLHLSQHSEKSEVPVQEREVQFSDRTEQSCASQGTDYASVPRRVPESRKEPGQRAPGVQQTGHSGQGVCKEVSYERQNGLYQIHQKPVTEQYKCQSSCNNTAKVAETSDHRVDLNDIHEAPERDGSPQRKISQTSTSGVSDEGTFTVDNKQKHQTSVSDSSAASTPRAQNISNSASTGGRLVFIPNDNSSQQSVVGYFPSVPVMPAPGSVVSSVAPPGPGTSQLSCLASQQDSAGMYTGYHSNQYAQMVAAGEVGSRKLRYLLKELKECNKVTKDVEISRLVREVDEVVDSIPQLAVTFNLQTEVDLAIQPLRSENCQLRRKVRLLTQQLKEKEEAPKDINFEILHLQTSNETLQKTLREEKNVKTRLAAEVQFVLGEIHKMKVERSKLISDMSERETKELKFRQETLLETQKLRHDIEMFKKDKDVTESRLEAAEKESHILQVTLTQRDAEITRQQSVIETMKAGISDLLKELEQSRAGERNFDHNNSYGLHQLLKVLREETSGFDRKERQTHQTTRKRSKTPERKNLNISSFSSASTPRLTRAALAFHDKKHPKPANPFNPVGRQGPASESEIDTLVELQRKERYVAPLKKSEHFGRRRTSSSSPVRLRGETGSGNQRDFGGRASPEVRETGFQPFDRFRFRSTTERKDRLGRQDLRENDIDEDDMGRLQGRQERQQQIRARRDENLAGNWRATQYNNAGRLPATTAPSEISVEQSRYSVTDYFRKYPVSAGSKIPDQPPSHNRRSSADNFTTSSPVKSSFHYRTSSEVEDRSAIGRPSSPPSNRNIKQLTLFKGINCDQTISAIPDDDNVSSVSMDTVTTANSVDDRRFRNGIATLDANILKLQQALQKTKSMLS